MSTLQNPFVIQCSICKQIIGDSFALLDFKNKKLVLHSISSYTSISKTKEESTSGTDNGCTFLKIYCSCNAEVGKKYITTNEGNKSFLGKFCIEINKIIVYRLGTSVNDKIPTLSEFSEEILKLQRFCSYIYDRVESLDLKIEKSKSKENVKLKSKISRVDNKRKSRIRIASDESLID
ncbi:Kinetochore protein mis18 [Dictyocoela muelleri]|nr:Kinetochore protein mis18 [Dictyocoela muelleri]